MTRYAMDARWITREISGIGVYALELARRLPALEPVSEFLFYVRDPEARDRLLGGELGRLANVRAVPLPYGVHSLTGQWRLARELRERGVDLFHSPGYAFPLPAFPVGRPRRMRLVVTLHDIVPLMGPAFVARSRKRHLLPLYRMIHVEAIRRADRVICVSDSARSDILRRLRVPRHRHARLCTVHNGVADRYRPAARRESGPPTILYVGRADPYKNLLGLVSAFARVHERLGGGVRLRIVGSPDPRYPEPLRATESAGVARDVEWSGHLPDDALLGAYLDATLLAFPSRYEGFGLPVAEAMACGLPVVCSDRSSLPEVTGDAALLVDPDDPEALAAAILRVIEEPELAETLARRGLERARRFTWDRSARETLAVYREALGVEGPRLESSERSHA